MAPCRRRADEHSGRRAGSSGQGRAAAGRASEEVLPDQARDRVPARDGPGARRRRRQHRDQGRGDARPGRRVRLRQIHPRPLHHQAAGADQRNGRLRRQGHLAALQARAPADPRRRADGLPGPVRVAEPPQAGGNHHRRSPAHPWRFQPPADQGASAGAAEACRPVTGAHQPLPARVLRRPAPADRRRAGACAASQADHRRRAGLGARRIDQGPGHQPARRPAG